MPDLVECLLQVQEDCCRLFFIIEIITDVVQEFNKLESG